MSQGYEEFARAYIEPERHHDSYLRFLMRKAQPEQTKAGEGDR